jgi:hypothetical protein
MQYISALVGHLGRIRHASKLSFVVIKPPRGGRHFAGTDPAHAVVANGSPGQVRDPYQCRSSQNGYTSRRAANTAEVLRLRSRCEVDGQEEMTA